MKTDLQRASLYPSMRNNLQRVGLTPVGLISLILLGLIPIFVTDNAIVRLMISAMMYGVFAMAFDFTSGFINITNFGFSAFWGIGAYTSAILSTKLGMSPWIGLFCGFITAGIAGFLLGLLTIRLGGIFASCMTWFVALALFAVATNWVSLTDGSKGLGVDPLIDATTYTGIFYTLFIILIAVYIALMVITKSNIGTAFRAIGQDVEAAQAAGIDPSKYKIINFTLSCAIGGLVGAFYAHFSGIILPKLFQTSNTVEIMALAYIGGRGKIWGSLLCAIVLIPVMDYMKGLMEFRIILYGLLMIMIMIYYPKGIAGFIESLKYKFGKKVI